MVIKSIVNKSNKYLLLIVCTMADEISLGNILVSGHYTRTTMKDKNSNIMWLESHSSIYIVFVTIFKQ